MAPRSARAAARCRSAFCRRRRSDWERARHSCGRPCAGRLQGSTERVPARPPVTETAMGVDVEIIAPLRAVSSELANRTPASRQWRSAGATTVAPMREEARDPARLQRRIQRGAVAHAKLHGGEPRPMGNIGRLGPEMAAEGSRIHHLDVAARRRRGDPARCGGKVAHAGEGRQENVMVVGFSATNTTPATALAVLGCC